MVAARADSVARADSIVLPILSSFSYGLYAGALSIFGLVFAPRKAWQLTEIVTDYELSGPFRVGEGPIAARIGG